LEKQRQQLDITKMDKDFLEAGNFLVIAILRQNVYWQHREMIK
jgi:hypothetical protein